MFMSLFLIKSATSKEAMSHLSPLTLQNQPAAVVCLHLCTHLLWTAHLFVSTSVCTYVFLTFSSSKAGLLSTHASV